MTTGQRDWAAVFSEEFASDESRVQARIWAEVFGADYPREVSPYSYTSRSELARFAAEVNVGAGDLLVDVGSGRGGPGLGSPRRRVLDTSRSTSRPPGWQR